MSAFMGSELDGGAVSVPAELYGGLYSYMVNG